MKFKSQKMLKIMQNTIKSILKDKNHNLCILYPSLERAFSSGLLKNASYYNSHGWFDYEFKSGETLLDLSLSLRKAG